MTLEHWLQHECTHEAPTEEDLFDCAYQRLRALQIELPAERELRRVVRAALHGFFHDLYTRVTARLPETVRATFDQLLVVGPEESVSRFEQLKAPPAAPTITHLQQEITKLQTLRALGVPG